MSLMQLTAVELGKKIKAGEVSVVEATEAALAAIEAKEEKVNSFVTVDREGALKQAEEVQKKIDAGELTSPLAGVPVAIKDNMCTEGLLTTCSSKILGNFVPTFTSEAVLNLQKAGAVILGKTNMDEFAMGSTTETSAFGETKNPWNTEHVPGGSSGGSCAAVAAGECFYALGSDTGGSIRQPSSFCGVTGIKPTYGTVSRYGLIAYGSSLDQIGPVAKDVTDCATILETIASHDTKDSTSVERDDTDFTSALVDDVKGMKIGIPKDYFGEGLDTEVKDAVLAAAKKLEEKGAIVEAAPMGRAITATARLQRRSSRGFRPPTRCGFMKVSVLSAKHAGTESVIPAVSRRRQCSTVCAWRRRSAVQSCAASRASPRSPRKRAGCLS